MSESVVYYAEVPEGQVRTPVNPPTRRGELMAAGISTSIIAAIALGMRLYTRTRVLNRKPEADDWLVASAFIVSVAMLAFVQKDIDHGLTYHVWDIPQETYHIGERLYGLLAYLAFIFSVSLAKISMLVLYLRITPHRWFHWICYTCIAVVAGYSIAAALVESLACKPLQGIVDESLDAECYNSYPAYIALSSLNIAMDIIILLLPIPLVMRMQLPRRQKISVSFLFATGIIVCAVALKRVTYIPFLEESEDYDWDATPDMILCYIEVNFGIVCASVPVIRPFFTRLLSGFFAHRHKSSDVKLSRLERNDAITTAEQKTTTERQLLKHRNMGPNESYDDRKNLSSCSDNEGVQVPDSSRV